MKQTKEKILIINPADQPRQEVLALLKGLRKERVDLRLIISESAKDSIVDDYRVDYYIFNDYYIPKIRYTLPSISFIMCLIKNKDADIVHNASYIYLTNILGILSACIYGKKSIITVDAVVGYDWKYGNELVDMFSLIYTYSIGMCMFYISDEVIALSDRVRSSVLDVTECASISTIPNGIDTDTYRMKENPEHNRAESNIINLLYVGRLDPVKNVGALIDVVKFLSEDSKTRYHLTIVGDGSSKDRLESKTRSLGLSNKVSFVGHQNDVVSYYNMSDIFVMGSRSEGQPTVVMEAQSCGLPVVSTDVGCVNELILVGIIVNKATPTELRDAIRELVRQGTLYPQTQAREFIRSNYSISVMCQRYVSIYRRLVEYDA